MIQTDLSIALRIPNLESRTQLAPANLNDQIPRADEENVRLMERYSALDLPIGGSRTRLAHYFTQTLGHRG